MPHEEELSQSESWIWILSMTMVVLVALQIIFIMTLVITAAVTVFGYNTYVIVWVPNAYLPVAIYVAIIAQSIWRKDLAGIPALFLSVPFFAMAQWFGWQNVAWMVRLLCKRVLCTPTGLATDAPLKTADISDDLYNGTSPLWTYRTVNGTVPGPQLRQAQLALGWISGFLVLGIGIAHFLVIIFKSNLCGQNNDTPVYKKHPGKYCYWSNGIRLRNPCHACSDFRIIPRNIPNALEPLRVLCGVLGLGFGIIELAITGVVLTTNTPPSPGGGGATPLMLIGLVWSMYPLMKRETLKFITGHEEENHGWKTNHVAYATLIIFIPAIVLGWMSINGQIKRGYYISSVPCNMTTIVGQSQIQLTGYNQGLCDFVGMGTKASALMTTILGSLCFTFLAADAFYANIKDVPPPEPDSSESDDEPYSKKN